MSYTVTAARWADAAKTAAFLSTEEEGEVLASAEGNEEAWDALSNWPGKVSAFNDPKPAIPAIVTMRQAKLTLSRAGILAAANAAIAAMPGQVGEEAQIEWTFASELRRDHPLVAGLGQTLGLDESAIDELFIAAAQIA